MCVCVCVCVCVCGVCVCVCVCGGGGGGLMLTFNNEMIQQLKDRLYLYNCLLLFVYMSVSCLRMVCLH